MFVTLSPWIPYFGHGHFTIAQTIIVSFQEEQYSSPWLNWALDGLPWNPQAFQDQALNSISSVGKEA